MMYIITHHFDQTFFTSVCSSTHTGSESEWWECDRRSPLHSWIVEPACHRHRWGNGRRYHSEHAARAIEGRRLSSSIWRAASARRPTRRNKDKSYSWWCTQSSPSLDRELSEDDTDDRGREISAAVLSLQLPNGFPPVPVMLWWGYIAKSLCREGNDWKANNK